MISWLQTLTLTLPLAVVGGDDDPGGVSLMSLASTLDGAVDDMRVGGLLRAYYDHADSELGGGSDDVGGFRLYDAQVWFSAQAFGFDVFARGDFGEASSFPPKTSSGVVSFELRDFYVRRPITEDVDVYLGQFKCPLVASGNMGDGNLAMIDRTRIGQLFSMPGAYQPGAAVIYDDGRLHGKVVLQNGADGATDGNGIVVRGEYRMGEHANHHEGALDKPGFNGTFGAGYFMDDSDIGGEDFGSAWAVDAYTNYDAFSAHGEILGADEELASRALGNTTDDAMPYSLTLGYLFAPEWEGFFRYQDLDNEVDASIIGAGVNYYVHGHQAKWQIGVSQYDDDNIDGTILQGGLSIGLSQPNGV